MHITAAHSIYIVNLGSLTLFPSRFNGKKMSPGKIHPFINAKLMLESAKLAHPVPMHFVLSGKIVNNIEITIFSKPICQWYQTLYIYFRHQYSFVLHFKLLLYI